MANIMTPTFSNRQCFKIPRSKQRHIFITLCFLGLGAGLVITGSGVYVAFDLGGKLKAENYVQNGDSSGNEGVAEANRIYQRFFALEKAMNSMVLELLSSNVGQTLMTLGVLLLFLNALGLLGAAFRLRPLLLMYLILITTMMLTEIICFVTVVHEESPLSRQGCDVARDELTVDEKYMGPDRTEDRWLASFYVIMIVLDCCGVDGPQDFEGLFDDKYVPETCCTRKFLLDTVRSRGPTPCSRDPTDNKNTHEISDDARASPETSINVNSSDRNVVKGCRTDSVKERLPLINLTVCTKAKPNSAASLLYQKQKGCCEAIFEKIRSNFSWIIPLFVILLLMQATSVVTAIFLISKKLIQSKLLLDCNPL